MPIIRRARTARQQVDLLKGHIRLRIETDTNGIDRDELVTFLENRGFTNQQIVTALTELQSENIIQIDP